MQVCKLTQMNATFKYYDSCIFKNCHFDYIFLNSLQVAYRWRLFHRPLIGLIRLIVIEGEDVIADSGNIINEELKGGKIGVLGFR